MKTAIGSKIADLALVDLNQFSIDAIFIRAPPWEREKNPKRTILLSCSCAFLRLSTHTLGFFRLVSASLISLFCEYHKPRSCMTFVCIIKLFIFSWLPLWIYLTLVLHTRFAAISISTKEQNRYLHTPPGTCEYFVLVLCTQFQFVTLSNKPHQSK